MNGGGARRVSDKERGKQDIEKMREEARRRIEEITRKVEENLRNVKVRLIVLSGKGGVGKTFVSTSLAFYLGKKGYKVGLLDADETGAAAPFVLGERKKPVYVRVDTGKMMPIEARYNIKFISVEPLLPSGETPLMWMGPLRTKLLLDFLGSVEWGDLDFLIADMPPGAGDEVITMATALGEPRYAIVVGSPGRIATSVVRSAIVFCRKMNIPILGLIENMSYFRCPDGSILEVFGESTVEELSREYGVPVLGRIPIDPVVREANDKGKPVFELSPGSEVDKMLESIVDKILAQLKDQGVL